MWELDCEETWALKNWCFWTVVLEKTLESPLDCKEIQPVHPKGNQSWIFIGRTDAEAETPILGPPDAKSWLIWKDPDVGKDWGQEEKGTTEEETVGWHHRLNGHKIGWTPAVGDGQGGLACCNSWGHKESDMTERLNGLNWTEVPSWSKPISTLKASVMRPLVTTYMLGGGWGGWMASLIQWTWVWVNSRVGDGQGGLACCSSWGHKESDTTEWLNWTDLNWSC